MELDTSMKNRNLDHMEPGAHMVISKSDTFKGLLSNKWLPKIIFVRNPFGNDGRFWALERRLEGACSFDCNGVSEVAFCSIDTTLAAVSPCCATALDKSESFDTALVFDCDVIKLLDWSTLATCFGSSVSVPIRLIDGLRSVVSPLLMFGDDADIFRWRRRNGYSLELASGDGGVSGIITLTSGAGKFVGFMAPEKMEIVE